MTKKNGTDSVQGEGDYESAKRYQDGAHEFAKSGKVDEAARKAKPNSNEERKEMERAEEVGKDHAKK